MSQQSQDDHWQPPEQDANEMWTVPLWPSIQHVQQDRGTDSACEAIGVIRELQEWKCYCSHHTGSGQQDTDSAIVAIRNIKATIRTDSASVAIGVTNEQEADSAIVAIRENRKREQQPTVSM
jgi:hypothetical protein